MSSSDHHDDEEPFDVPAHLRKGIHHADQRAAVDDAVDMIAWMAAEMGVPDLGHTSVLDIGCGVKFTQAFYGRRIPVKRYHGVDVDRRMITFLDETVKDPRFSYRYISVYNARYHRRGGEPLSADIDIGAAAQTFDLVCLFSVFTHLAPPDFQAMLHLARRYIAADGAFIFTAFLDDTIKGDFADQEPDMPLLRAVYRESAVRVFAENAGWSVKHIVRPEQRQHRLVCSPV